MLFLIYFFIVLHSTEGYDIFEGISHQASCLSPRHLTGCKGTLLENFKPKNKGVNINKPDTRLFLYTRENPEEAEYLHDCGGSLPSNTNFDPNSKTEVFVHGWVDGVCVTAWMREVRDQLFIRGKYNVILVDWTWGNSPDYVGAALNIKVVAEQLAFVLNNIMKVSNTSAKDIHIVGHSFGAHIAGHTGKILKNIGRITGLDPALAPFKYSDPSERLAITDADLVDVIHADGTKCAILIGGGFITPLGHADFYVNGGYLPQLSCIPYILSSFLKGDVVYASLSALSINLCSHVQALQYYKVTINPGDCSYTGHECSSHSDFEDGKCDSCGQNGSSCALMGMDFGQNFQKKMNESRKYYLKLGTLCPYCPV